MGNTVRQNLGPVSAYALAVANGFTGTESEWATLQAEAGQHGREAKDAADRARTSETAAQEANKAANLSAEVAKLSSDQAKQALSELLAMIGTDVATLVGGKIPLSQIPATATQEIYTVTDESQLTGLVAQRGDLAELVEEVDGRQLITKTWQCLGDPARRDSWIEWGTSYAVQSGHSSTATNAENANTINGIRMVEMTEEEYENSAKDPNTYYLVYFPDAEIPPDPDPAPEPAPQQ